MPTSIGDSLHAGMGGPVGEGNEHRETVRRTSFSSAGGRSSASSYMFFSKRLKCKMRFGARSGQNGSEPKLVSILPVSELKTEKLITIGLVEQSPGILGP